MSVQRVLNRLSGYFIHFAHGDMAPYSDSERYTRLDPADWSEITYFKSRDYCPQSIRLLASYTLHTEFNNGLFDVQLALRGDALASALGPKGIRSFPGMDDVIEDIPSLSNLTRRQALDILSRFDNGEPLHTLTGDAQSQSILGLINAGEACYGSYTRRYSKDDAARRQSFADYADHIRNWDFPDRYLTNPHQDWFYDRDRQQKTPAPA